MTDCGGADECIDFSWDGSAAVSVVIDADTIASEVFFVRAWSKGMPDDIQSRCFLVYGTDLSVVDER